MDIMQPHKTRGNSTWRRESLPKHEFSAKTDAREEEEEGHRMCTICGTEDGAKKKQNAALCVDSSTAIKEFQTQTRGVIIFALISQFVKLLSDEVFIKSERNAKYH